MTQAPRQIAVVGAGLVGLSTAWHLQERGAAVTVLERRVVAAGASWGNAGWITPGLVSPLPHPDLLRYGVRAAMRPSSPVYVPPQADLALLRFLLRFVRNSTSRRWLRAAVSLAPLSREAIREFDAFVDASGARDSVRRAPILVCGTRPEDLVGVEEELRHASELGLPVRYEPVDAHEARRTAPVLSARIRSCLLLHDQRFIDPGRLAGTVAAELVARGTAILTGTAVTSVDPLGDAAVQLSTAAGDTLTFDAVVLANGAWLPDLARPLGVRMPLRPGRGYSFSVALDQLPSMPLYFPAARVACTPVGERLRVAGMMEFRPVDAPLDPRRLRAIADSVRPLLTTIDSSEPTEQWVGARPCTADGLPLIGPTVAPRVWVAGGHGMWGITLAAATGRIVADAITRGVLDRALAPFDPLR